MELCSGTIESIHNKIVEKFTMLKTILESMEVLINELLQDDKFSNIISIIESVPRLHITEFNQTKCEDGYYILTVIPYTQCTKTRKYNILDKLSTDIVSTENKYMSNVIHILNKYYNMDLPIDDANTHEYYRTIKSENFSSFLNEYACKLEDMLEDLIILINKQQDTEAIYKQLNRHQPSRYQIIMESIKKQCSYAKSIEIDLQMEKSNYDICVCGAKMVVLPTTSELKCEVCGNMHTLYGAIFDDKQIYNQEGQKCKHGSYDYNRHFRYWMDRIQARENKVFPPEQIATLTYIIERDNVKPQAITCQYMRSILKEAKLTKNNEHIPLLIKKFTGRAPPQLTFEEVRRVSIKFNKIMYLYELVKQKVNKYRPYYPYWIYKIIEYEFREAPKKLKLLDYIHLQSEDTVTKNDLIYEQICLLTSAEDNIYYTPTRRII